jgi:hypothetical protein
MRAMKLAAVGTMVLAFLALGLAPALAQDTESAAPKRAPARIRVHPLADYPGPNAVRQCTSWLATEYRPSGTVIVPRMRCWWERG